MMAASKTTRTPAAHSSSKPLEVEIWTKSGLQRFCEGGRKQFLSAHDQLLVTADELEQALRTLPGHAGLFGVDTRSVARRVVKPLRHAAGLSHETAIAIQSTWRAYLGLVDGPLQGQRHGGKVWNPND